MFTVTEDHLKLLWSKCNFPIPDAGMIFFGLRGCIPVNYSGTPFASQHDVNIHDVDYIHMRCTLGQWKPGVGFALFPASTVPEQGLVRSRIPHGGYGANQLMLGKYSYRKGDHKPGKPTGHRAFRQDGYFPVWRTADDDDYDLDGTDFVDLRKGYIAWDNLHCGWSNGPSDPSYSSIGCQVVAGFPKCSKRGNSSKDEGPWKLWLDNAYGISQSTFAYALFSGLELQRIAGQATSSVSMSLRYGSEGDLVGEMQQKLAEHGFDTGTVDSSFGFNTLQALLNFQRSAIGPQAADGIVGKMTADALGVQLPDLPTSGGGALPVFMPAGMAGEEEVLRGPPAAEVVTTTEPLEFEVTHTDDGGKRRYYAEAEGNKIFVGRRVTYGSNFGLTNIYDLGQTPGGIYDNTAAAAAHGAWAHFIWPTAIGESKGYFACINSYDRARFTIGFSQLAAHTPDENLIILFRRLLERDDAKRYFPDLLLVNGKVHQRISSTETKDLEKVTDGELRRFMSYLNPDLSQVDNAEVVAGARLITGMIEKPEHRDLQVALTIEIAKKKAARAADNGVPIKGRKLRYAMWVFDCLHQGRAKYTQLKAAVLSSSPEAELMKFGWPTHKERINAVKASMDKLVSDGTLDIDGLKFGEGDFEV
jgi:peptidoglycan hydrolase-like protein with peptidoglycan-binding domain